MLEPEADRRGRLHLSSAHMDLQERLPVVVRNREPCGIRVLAGRAVQVVDGLVPADRPVGRAGDHVHDVAVGRHEVPFRRFQRAPDPIIELHLDLGRLVRRVVGLQVHLLVRLAVGIRALVAAGVGVVPVHRPITVRGDVHLLVLVDVGVVLPTARAGAARHKGLRQVVGGPQGRVIGIAVVVTIVPIRFRRSAAPVEGSYEVLASCRRRQFQPSAVDPLALRIGRERFDDTDDLYVPTVLVAHCHERLVVVGRVRREALDNGRELPAGGIRQIVRVDGLLRIRSQRTAVLANPEAGILRARTGPYPLKRSGQGCP